MVIGNYTFENIFWVNKEHTAFNVDIIMQDNKRYPFTYLVNGDEQSDMHKFIKEHIDQFEIMEYPASLELRHTIAKQNMIRNHRNNLLSNTDKYMTLDYPISEECKNEIKTYRQALRDVPQQEGFPENVVWPEKPECLK